jgi:ethanolamine utilization microcompartment shell protein EutS
MKMVTTVKISFTEQSKAVTGAVHIESDILSDEENLKRTTELLDKVLKISSNKTLAKLK